MDIRAELEHRTCVCRKCRVLLTEDNKSKSRLSARICKSCQAIYMREYRRKNSKEYKAYCQSRREGHREEYRKANRKHYRTHKEELILRQRDWRRQNVLSRVRIQKEKRAYPANQKCELCHEVHKHLAYHHWDDVAPHKGVWVCMKCHRACEIIDGPKVDGLIAEEYRKVKMAVDHGC